MMFVETQSGISKMTKLYHKKRLISLKMTKWQLGGSLYGTCDRMATESKC